MKEQTHNKWWIHDQVAGGRCGGSHGLRIRLLGNLLGLLQLLGHLLVLPRRNWSMVLLYWTLIHNKKSVVLKNIEKQYCHKTYITKWKGILKITKIPWCWAMAAASCLFNAPTSGSILHSTCPGLGSAGFSGTSSWISSWISSVLGFFGGRPSGSAGCSDFVWSYHSSLDGHQLAHTPAFHSSQSSSVHPWAFDMLDLGHSWIWATVGFGPLVAKTKND